MRPLHIHVWSKDKDEPDEEIDAEHVDTYDDYVQYGYTNKEGKWVEIRVFKGE